MGEDGPVDLSTTDYTDLGLWRPVAASTAVPSGLNFTNSDSMGIGAAIVLNDVWSDVEAAIRNDATAHRWQHHGRGDRVGDDRRGHRRQRLLRPAAPASPARASRSRPAASSPRTACRARARAIVDETPLDDHGRRRHRRSVERLADRGDEPRRDAVGQPVGRDPDRVQHGRLGPHEPALRCRRRAARRPADLEAFGGNLHPAEALASVTSSPITSAGGVSVTATNTAQILAAALERRDLGAGGDHGRRRDERRRDPRLEHGQQPGPRDRRGRRDRHDAVSDCGDVTVAASDEARIDSHDDDVLRGRARRTTPAPASSTSGRTSRSPSTSSRSTPARATSSSATRSAPTTGRSTSTWARRSRSTS